MHNDISFDRTYFDDEERCGFYVPEMMKRTWAAQLKMMHILQQLLEKYTLRYFADFGTLLGAVRHKGFIPWDDDLDISMPRRDYNILLEHADEIGGGLLIRSIYNSEYYYNYHAVVTNSENAQRFEWNEKRMDDYYGCPFFCYIDIFPMDYIYSDPGLYKIQKELYYLCYKLVFDCASIENNLHDGRLLSLSDIESLAHDSRCDAGKRDIIKEFLKDLEKLKENLRRYLPGEQDLLYDGKILNRLCRIADRAAQICKEEEAQMVDYCPHMAYSTEKLWRRKEWFADVIELPFENISIAVPKSYDDVLKSRFGDDYMVPVRKTSTHEYPYYRSLIKVLVEGDTGEAYPEYKQKAEILETVDSMAQAQQEVDDCINRGKYRQVQKMLGDLQECAIGVGNAIEQRKGEGSFLVKPLEDYCENIYRLYQAIDAYKMNGTGESEIFIEGNNLKDQLKVVRGVLIKGYHQDVPKAWIKKLTKTCGDRKKVILYGLSAIELIGHSNSSPIKIRRAFEEFDACAGDICVLFCVPGKLQELLDRCQLSMSREYDEAIKECSQKVNVIIPKIEELELAVSIADAYCGDECPLLDKFKDTGKPVMIQNHLE